MWVRGKEHTEPPEAEVDNSLEESTSTSPVSSGPEETTWTLRFIFSLSQFCWNSLILERRLNIKLKHVVVTVSVSSIVTKFTEIWWYARKFGYFVILGILAVLTPSVVISVCDVCVYMLTVHQGALCALFPVCVSLTFRKVKTSISIFQLSCFQHSTSLLQDLYLRNGFYLTPSSCTSLPVSHLSSPQSDPGVMEVCQRY